MNRFIEPEIEVIKFDVNDVIATSLPQENYETESGLTPETPEFDIYG